MKILLILGSLPVVSGIVYVSAKYILPAMTPEQHMTLVQSIGNLSITISILTAVAIAIGSLIEKSKEKKDGTDISVNSNNESSS